MHFIVNFLASECNEIRKQVRFLHRKISVLICMAQIEGRALPCDWALSQSKAAMDPLQTSCQTAGTVQTGALALESSEYPQPPPGARVTLKEKGFWLKRANFNQPKQTNSTPWYKVIAVRRGIFISLWLQTFVGLVEAEKVSDVHNLLIYCHFSVTWASADKQQTQLTQRSWMSLLTSRGSSQPKFPVRVHHEFWRCPSPLEVAQRSWGKPGPRRQLLWMKLPIRKGRTNPPAFIYLFGF